MSNHHNSNPFSGANFLSSCPELFPELLELQGDCDNYAPLLRWPSEAASSTSPFLSEDSSPFTEASPLASPTRGLEPASLHQQHQHQQQQQQPTPASPFAFSFDGLWDPCAENASASATMADSFFDFDSANDADSDTPTTAASVAFTATSTATAVAPHAPQAATAVAPTVDDSASFAAPTVSAWTPTPIRSSRPHSHSHSHSHLHSNSHPQTSPASSGTHKEQHRATRTCSGCGLEKKRVYRYLGASAPFCNACNQHWRRHLHECPLCLKLRSLNATEELRGTDITHLDGPARPRRRDASASVSASASAHLSPESLSMSMSVSTPASTSASVSHFAAHAGPIRKRMAHPPPLAIHKPYSLLPAASFRS